MYELCEVVETGGNSDFVQNHLLQAALILDLSEEGGRRKLLSLVRKLMLEPTTSEEVTTQSLLEYQKVLI